MPDLMVEQPLRDSIDNLQEAVRRQVEAYFALGKLQLIESCYSWVSPLLSGMERTMAL